jgi:hypothetical protein
MGFLAERRVALAPKAERRLRRVLSRFDPAFPTPYERLARL